MDAQSIKRPRLQAPVLAITGSSCSGKTTLARLLVETLRTEGVDAELVEQDSFRCRSKGNKRDGRPSWEGPQFTDWGRLKDAVAAAAIRCAVVIVDGYMILDSFEQCPSLASMIEGVLWVNSTVHQVKGRRTVFPRAWGSAANYAELCVWPAHVEYQKRVGPHLEKIARTVFLEANDSREQRLQTAFCVVVHWLEELETFPLKNGVPEWRSLQNLEFGPQI